MKILKKLIYKEDGGSDQLIIAAILVVIGIGVALLFGDQIKSMVISLTEEPDLSEIKASNYSETDEETSEPEPRFVKNTMYEFTNNGDVYKFIDEQGNGFELEFVEDIIDDKGFHAVFVDSEGKKYFFVTSNPDASRFIGSE